MVPSGTSLPYASVPNPKRPSTAGAVNSGATSSQKKSYLRRGDGALLNSKQNPRPSSAAPRVINHVINPGFGCTSSRIITYRGHNELTTNANEYRALRIDPLQQARDMFREQLRNERGTKSETTTTSRMPKRPASAGPGSRRKIKSYRNGADGARRPLSAAPRSRRGDHHGFGGGGVGGRRRFRRRRSGRIKKRIPKRPKSAKQRRKRPEWVDVK